MKIDGKIDGKIPKGNKRAPRAANLPKKHRAGTIWDLLPKIVEGGWPDGKPLSFWQQET